MDWLTGMMNPNKWSTNSINKRDIIRMNSDVTASKLIKIKMPSSANKSTEAQPLELKILFFNLDKLPATAQFLVCCTCVVVFYLIYGYFQERIFQLEGFKPFGWYLTLVQFALYTVFGLAELQFKEDQTRKIPLKTYVFIAFLTVATMGLSNSSLGYLNYPTQVIFKCCKLIPVLIGGILIQGKRYGPIDVAACLCMSVGLIFFTLADSSVSPTFSLYGVVLISMALCADAVIGNVQEKVMKQHSCSNSEMVLYSYSIGFIYILIGQILSGQLVPAFSFCLQHPYETYGYGFIFSLTGYLGVSVVLSLVKSFGALVAVTVTTCRKAITIILSFMLFSKPFTVQYIYSGLVVLLGIYLNLYSKNKVSWDAKFKECFAKLFHGPKGIITVNTLENIV